MSGILLAHSEKAGPDLIYEHSPPKKNRMGKYATEIFFYMKRKEGTEQTKLILQVQKCTSKKF